MGSLDADESSELAAGGSGGAVSVREYPIVSVLLVKHSEYFRTLFTGGMAESAQRVVVVHVPASSEYVRAMESLLRAMYEDRLPPALAADRDALLTLLVLCDRFLVPAVARLAVDALVCLRLPLQYADAVLARYPLTADECALSAELDPLLDHCRWQLVMRFSPLQDHWQSPAWRAISPEAMAALLGCSPLAADSEDTVWRALMEWWKPRDRSMAPNMAAKLLLPVRYPLMTEQCLSEVHDSALYKQHSRWMEPMLWDALRYCTATTDATRAQLEQQFQEFQGHAFFPRPWLADAEFAGVHLLADDTGTLPKSLPVFGRHRLVVQLRRMGDRMRCFLRFDGTRLTLCYALFLFEWPDPAASASSANANPSDALAPISWRRVSGARTVTLTSNWDMKDFGCSFTPWDTIVDSPCFRDGRCRVRVLLVHHSVAD